MLLLAVIESGWAIFIWNSAAEITRRAARLAVVCPAADSAITTLALRGSRGLPGLAPTHLQFRYLSLGGGEVGAAAAAFVQVVLRDYRVALLFPYGYHYTSLNEHTHFHVVVIDGVFEPDSEHGVRFIEVEELDADDAEAVQTQVRRRMLRAFVRRGVLEKEDRKEMGRQRTHRGPRPIRA